MCKPYGACVLLPHTTGMRCRAGAYHSIVLWRLAIPTPLISPQGVSVFQHHRSAARVHTHQQMTSLQSFGDFDTPLAVLPTHSFELVYSKGRMCAAASHHACTTAGAYYSPLWWLLMDCLLQQQVRARAGAMAACDAHTCLLQTVGCT